MSVELSTWLLEDIDESLLESQSTVTPLQTDIGYNVYSNSIGYSDYYNYDRSYYDYYNYSVYYNYYDYSVYYNYYDYYNYSNSISVTRHPISQSALVGDTVTFSVGASNTIDSCQWYIADSSTGVGTAITGATTPTLSVLVTRELDNMYYYCIVRRGGNTSTSNRALLTVMSVDAFDIYTNVGSTTNLFFVRANPPTTEIVSAVVSDPSIATVSNSGEITGVSIGTTDCVVTGSNGASAEFHITVLNDTPADKLVSILSNIAIAIREYRGVSYNIYPNQMANLLKGTLESKAYSTIEELFTDIAESVREIDGSTESISPDNLYYRIFSLTL